MSLPLGLAARLVEGGTPHAVGAPGLPFDVYDTIARLRVVGSETARLESNGAALDVRVSRETRIYCERNPDALWVADLSASDERGTLVPFAPPRRLRVTAGVPIKVPASLVDSLSEARLRLGDDLARVGLALRRPEVAVVGQRAVAALDKDDGRSVTWWLPDGGALELRVEVTDEGWALHVVDLVSPRDARKANTGPSALLFFERDARFPLVADTAPDVAPLDALDVFRPARSALFDAWARYAAIARQEHEERERERSQYPIAYRCARQRERGWVAEVAGLSEEAIAAWLGTDVAEGRTVRVRQPVARVEGEVETGPYTLETALLRGPGLVELQLVPGRGAPPLLEQGMLQAREDKGERTRREREREALDTLASGRAACARLVDLLARPGSATAPPLRPLPLPAAERLDEHQLRAVQLIAGCEDLVAIQGPPGTGKTRVIVEAIRQIEAAARARGEQVRVLLSSVQNEAVANIVERLAIGGSMVVRLVKRAARDEEEGFDFAAWSRKQGESIVAGLERRLAGHGVAETLTKVREAETEVNELRGWLALGPSAHDVVIARLRALASSQDSLLGGLLRGEAARLADALEAPGPPAREDDALPELPASPAEVGAWWEVVRERCPVALRSEIGMRVQALAEALATPNPVRRDLVVPPRWKALRVAATGLGATDPEGRREASGPSGADGDPVAADPVTALDAWAARALATLRELRAGIEARPQAVALRFLQAIKEDPRAWASIVDRHGNAVAATCSMAARAVLDPGEAYDWVIVDEAGRASPFELLVPMVQGKRVVLIGDHRQLPPTVDDALVRRANEAAPAGADIRYETLFGSLFALLPPGCKARLAVQYRMHSDIGDLVDMLFYRPAGEPLASGLTGPRTDERKLPWDVFGRRPIQWVEVAPRGERTEENPEEAEKVLGLLREYERAGAEEKSVAVICPYSRQRLLLKRKLEHEPALQRISQLKTIDAVQGREYPVVILCLVRTDRRPGFLASPNRLNVAVSRAQNQLVVVGASRRFLDSEAVRVRAPALRRLVETLTAKGGAS